MNLKPQVKIDAEGYVEEITLAGNIGGIEVELTGEVEDYLKNYRAYKFVNGKLIKDLERLDFLLAEDKKNLLRRQRQLECFSIINRGALWYDTLTSSQKEELNIWYHQWLNVTDTLVVPEYPSWLT